MAWIKCIPYEEATGKLKRIYDKIKGPDNYLDNILTIHSLRPHTLTGHMQLYKNVLHNSNNSLPKWYLEAIGVYVSYLNNCAYCVEHHYKGMSRILGAEKADQVRKGLKSHDFSEVMEPRFQAAMKYARELTLEPHKLDIARIRDMKKSGLDEGEILEINQVSAYFNYANRTVLGMGVSLKGDVLGMSPNDSEDPDNWHHK